MKLHTIQFSSVQSLSHVRLFATPWTTAHQAFLSITNSRSPPKLMSIESLMPSSHLILCHPLLLLPSIFPSIRVFSNESALCIRWPKYWSFSFNISPSNEHPGLISFRMDYLIEVFKCLPETKSDWRIFSTSSLGDLIPISPRKPSKFFPGIMSSSGKLTAKTVSCDSRNKKKLFSNWSSLWI